MNKLISILLFCLIPVSLIAQIQADKVLVSKDSVMIGAGTTTVVQTESTEHNRPGRYQFRAGMDILSGNGESSISARFYMTHGHRFTPFLSVGLGLGYTSYNNPMSMIPLFIDLTYRFADRGTTPYISLKTGYNFALQPDDELQIDSYTGGLLFNPTAGVEISFNRGMSIYFSAGFNIDNSSYQYETWGNRTVNNYLSFRRLSFGTGFVF